MTPQELVDRLGRFSKRLEMEGRYTDQNIVDEAVRIIRADYPESEIPDLCCMWCGGEKPQSGWHFICGPQALCSEKCKTEFKAAF